MLSIHDGIMTYFHCYPSSYRLHRNELDSISDPEQRHRRLVELNVIEQCINLFKTGVVQRQRVETFRERSKPQVDPKALDYTTPRIHACVFDPKTGDMNRLQVDFREYIEELHTIYDLYTLDEPEVVSEKPHAPRPIDEFDHEQHARDPNDVFGGKAGVVNGAREQSSDEYSRKGDAPGDSRDPNDFYPANGVNQRSRDSNDAYRTPPAATRAQQHPGAYSSMDTVRTPRDSYNNNYVAGNDRTKDLSYSATDGTRYPEDNYDPYRATDGANVQRGPFDNYGPRVNERRDLNEIYRPPLRATDVPREFEEEYDPYGVTDNAPEYSEDYGPYTEGPRPLQEPYAPYGPASGATNNYAPPPARRGQRQSAPGGSYLDGLAKDREGASNGYPDGGSNGFSY
jgi:hypothetical protein